MDDRFVVMAEYFNAAHSGRRKEIIKSIEVNCRIPQVKSVIIFLDRELKLPSSLAKVLSKENYSKIKIVSTPPGKRSTYSDFFCYANQYLIGENCALCNNDISFDETLDQIRFLDDFNLNDHFICLTRWDVMKDNSLRFKQPARIRKNSQDAWIFKAPLPDKMLEKGGFYMGRPGCDGMVSYLAIISGLKVFNPSELVRAKHLHLSGYRTYGKKHRMGGDDIYICTFPSDKIEFDPSKLMYKFSSPVKKIYGEDAIDMAKRLEKQNEKHWYYAIQKCLGV